MIIELPQAAIEKLHSIPNDAVKPFNIPVAIYINEAVNLHARASIDLSVLMKLNMPADLLQQLKEGIEFLELTEAIWQEQLSQKDVILKQWKAASQELRTCYTDLNRKLSFAFRNNNELLMAIKSFKNKRKYADILQALNDIAVFAKEHHSSLQGVNFDMQMLDDAATMAHDLPKLYAKANALRNNSADEKVLRDRAYAYLKKVVDELRSYGRFAFRDDKAVLEHYGSRYRRNLQKMRRKNQL